MIGRSHSPSRRRTDSFIASTIKTSEKRFHTYARDRDGPKRGPFARIAPTRGRLNPRTGDPQSAGLLAQGHVLSLEDESDRTALPEWPTLLESKVEPEERRIALVVVRRYRDVPRERRERRARVEHEPGSRPPSATQIVGKNRIQHVRAIELTRNGGHRVASLRCDEVGLARRSRKGIG